MTDKQTLRRALLAQRNSIPPDQKRAWDAAINAAIISHPWFQESQVILGYYPINSEPDIRPALEAALQQGKTLCLPRCDPAKSEMTFHPVKDLANLKPGAHNIPEPPNNYALRITHYELCLVPGLAFDQTGCRLGYGKGYYDRFLSRFGGHSIGVCYGAMVQAALPRGAHDMAVEQIVTE